MILDIMTSLKANLYERAASPLAGAFMISWLVWNYELVLVLFSSWPVLTKIDYVQTEHFVNGEKLLSLALGWPLATAIITIVLYPIPAKIAALWWLFIKKLFKKARVRIEDDNPLTQEEVNRLRFGSLAAENEFAEAIMIKNEEIDRLTELINKSMINEGDLRNQGKIDRTKIKELSDEIQDLRPRPTYEFYQGDFKQWCWRIMDPGGKIIGESKDGYTTKKEAEKSLEKYLE